MQMTRVGYRVLPLLLWSAACLAASAPARADEKLAGIACRSVHLGYDAPQGSSFLCEVTVRQSAPGTYFCVCGFNHGYFGLQELADGKKLLIFSIWDPGNQDDPKTVKEEQRVKLVHQGEKVRIGRFGGEGTGGQSFLDYDWKTDQPYRFLVMATYAKPRMEYAGWFYDPVAEKWRHMVTFFTLTKGELLGGYYSFIEDFRRNRVSAGQTRRAEFGGGWVQAEEGKWQALRSAQFTTDSNPVTNIDAGTVEDRFFLTTGGKITNDHTPLGKPVTLKESSATQPVDLPPGE